LKKYGIQATPRRVEARSSYMLDTDAREEEIPPAPDGPHSVRRLAIVRPVKFSTREDNEENGKS